MTLLIALGVLSVIFSALSFALIGSLVFSVFKALFKGNYDDVLDSIYTGGPRFVFGWLFGGLASACMSAFGITAVVLIIIAIL